MSISKFTVSATFRLVMALSTASFPLVAAAQEQTVYYAQGSEGAAETTFPFLVLKLALSKSGKPYALKPSPIGKANAKRTTDAMVADGLIDVQWVGANLMD